jgi:hypothetical protein
MVFTAVPSRFRRSWPKILASRLAARPEIVSRGFFLRLGRRTSIPSPFKNRQRFSPAVLKIAARFGIGNPIQFHQTICVKIVATSPLILSSKPLPPIEHRREFRQATSGVGIYLRLI